MSAATNPTPGRLSPPAPDPEMPARPGRRGPWKLIALLALIGMGGLAAYQFWSKKPAASQPGPLAVIPTIRVTTGAMERVARIGGQTASQAYSSIKAPIMRGPESGREMILLFLVKSGSKVKKGDLLVQIDAQASMDHIEDVKDTVESAEADIKKRRAEQFIDMETLVQSLRVAEAEWKKAKLDYAGSEMRTSIDRELLKIAEDEAEARYKELHADVAQKEASQKAEIRILEITRERHIRHLRRHDDDVNRYAIRSPMDGLAVVQTTFRGGDLQAIQQGDQVTPGQILIRVVDIDRMLVEATVNQAESGSFRVGQETRIRLDAFPGLQFSGKIFSIGAMAVGGWRQGFYIRTVPVSIRIQGADPRLIPDLSASVDVLMDRADRQRQVPLTALFREGGQWVAFVRRGAGFEKRAVTVGLQNGTHAAVTEGLQDDDEVALERPQGS